MYKNFNVFLDSGAFSVMSKGRVIKLDDYMNTLSKIKNNVEVYANLDVIGDGEASYQNWLELRRNGFNPLPVYHANTDEGYLKKYMDETDYVGFGAVAKMVTKGRIRHFDYLWSKYLLKENKEPRIKAHVFGVTSPDIMGRYPWYSVDSTSWIKFSAYGRIILPLYRDGKWKYEGVPWVVGLSYSKEDIGLRGMSPMLKDIVLKYIHKFAFEKEKLGYHDELVNKGSKGFGIHHREKKEIKHLGSINRACLNALYYVEWLRSREYPKVFYFGGSEIYYAALIKRLHKRKEHRELLNRLGVLVTFAMFNNEVKKYVGLEEKTDEQIETTGIVSCG